MSNNEKYEWETTTKKRHKWTAFVVAALTGLIKDKELDPGQISLLHLEQIVESARRGDDDLNSTLEGSNLRELI